MVGYELDLECESSEDGVCGKVFRSHDVIKVDVFRKPNEGTTKVKFVFNPSMKEPRFGQMYFEPGKNYLDIGQIGTMKHFPMHYETGSHGGGEYEPVTGDWAGRRKLKAAIGRSVFLENTLTEPIILCDKKSRRKSSPGVSLSPGEKLQLTEGTEYHLTRKKGGVGATCGVQELAWKLSTGEVHDDDQTGYSFTRNKRASNLIDHMDYSIALKCVSSKGLCKSFGGRRIKVPDDAQSDPDLSITYVVQPVEGKVKDIKEDTSLAESIFSILSQFTTEGVYGKVHDAEITPQKTVQQ